MSWLGDPMPAPAPPTVAGLSPLQELGESLMPIFSLALPILIALYMIPRHNNEHWARAGAAFRAMIRWQTLTTHTQVDDPQAPPPEPAADLEPARVVTEDLSSPAGCNAARWLKPTKTRSVLHEGAIPSIVVGQTNVDLRAEARGRWPSGPASTVGNFHSFPGGRACLQTFALRRLGVPVSLVAHVGTDANGYKVKQMLREEGANVEAVSEDPSADTGVAIQILTADDRVKFNVACGGANGLVGDLELQVTV